MVQGGDPTGTGRGGTSIYGQKLSAFHSIFRRRANRLPFSEDEIHHELRFTGAGILAMANSGPNTNGTFQVCLVRFKSHFDLYILQVHNSSLR